MAGFSLPARLEAGHHGSVGRSLRVLVVDDHAPFRRTARQILEQAGFEVVGEATDGAQALDLALALRPDGVIVASALFLAWTPSRPRGRALGLPGPDNRE